MAPPAMLMEELVEQFLLRIPPDDPASLVRAALVYKEWRRIVADPGFRRRFRELHRTPPMLGALCVRYGKGWVSRFIPTVSCLPQADHCYCLALDARHGRVLFFRGRVLKHDGCCVLFRVSDPVTGEFWELPELMLSHHRSSWNVAVLCADDHGTCDHLDCHGGPFFVVVVECDRGNMRVHTYSSETGCWSGPADGAQSPTTNFKLAHPALVGSTLYFFIYGSENVPCILKYDLPTRTMSVIQLPRDFSLDCAVLTTVEDGGLGVATMEESRLYLWSMETGLEGDVGWVQTGDIQLQTLLPDNVVISHKFVGFAHGVGVFFVGTNEGLFSIDLKSRRVRKVCSESCGEGGIQRVVPYMSFYTPALGMTSAGEVSDAGTSST